MNKTTPQEEDADTRGLTDGELLSATRAAILSLRRRNIHQPRWTMATGLLQAAVEKLDQAERCAPPGAWDR